MTTDEIQKNAEAQMPDFIRHSSFAIRHC